MTPEVAALIDLIAARHLVTASDILSRSRTQSVAAARRELLVELHDHYGKSLNECAQILGRDHSTIAWYLRAERPGDVVPEMRVEGSP